MLRFVGHVETMGAVARLHRLTHGDPWKATPDCEQMTDATMPHKTLLLRCQKNPTVENFPDDLPVHDQLEFEQNNAWKNVVARARKVIFADPALLDLLDAAAPVGRVVISVLAPHGVMSWHKDVGDYAKRHVRFHVPIVTNPACTLYAGNMQAHVPVGTVALLNVLDLHCAANWGLAARSHLIFEIRRRDAEEAAA